MFNLRNFTVFSFCLICLVNANAAVRTYCPNAISCKETSLTSCTLVNGAGFKISNAKNPASVVPGYYKFTGAVGQMQNPSAASCSYSMKSIILTASSHNSSLVPDMNNPNWVNQNYFGLAACPRRNVAACPFIPK